MTMDDNGLERFLRQIDPVEEGELASLETRESAAALLERIVHADEQAELVGGGGRRRSTKHSVVAISFVAVALATTAAVFALTSRPSSDPLSVGCYERLDQQANTAIVSLVDTELTPAAACAARWQSAFGTSTPSILVTCVVSGGGTGVFPNNGQLAPEQACASIGAALPAGGTPYGGLSAEQVRGLARDLQDRYERIDERPECAGNAALKNQALEVLAAHRAEAWEVEDLTSSEQEWTFSDGTVRTVAVPATEDGQRCADFTVDALNGRVLIVNGWPELPGAG
jgi:hypothetical protein